VYESGTFFVQRRRIALIAHLDHPTRRLAGDHAFGFMCFREIQIIRNHMITLTTTGACVNAG
jgi:hypothetical protein